MVKQTVVWARAFVHWLISEFRFLWLALFFVVVPFFVVFFLTGATEIQFRFTGLVLQWLGLGTVVHGIEETRMLFGHPNIVQLLLEKLLRFPRLRRDVFIHVGSGVITTDVGSVTAYGWRNIDPAAPIEAQVAALTQNMEHIKQRLDQMQKDVDSKISKHSVALHEEKKEREQGDKKLSMILEAAETGGLHISLMGVFWLAIGLLLTTFSPEISQWAM